MPLASRPARRTPPSARAPRGFTIVEVIVALTLLASGALAVVAATALAVRAVGAAETQQVATMAARNRLESLALRGCSDVANDSTLDEALGLRERWAASQPRNGVRLLIDSVAYVHRGDRHVVVVQRLVVC